MSLYENLQHQINIAVVQVLVLKQKTLGNVAFSFPAFVFPEPQCAPDSGHFLTLALWNANEGF